MNQPSLNGIAPELTIWDVAVSLGVPRPLMGKWIKENGELAVAEMIGRMAIKRPADPCAWGTACLQERLRLPAEDEKLWAYAKKHGLSEPGHLESYKSYRKKLWQEIRARQN